MKTCLRWAFILGIMLFLAQLLDQQPVTPWIP